MVVISGKEQLHQGFLPLLSSGLATDLVQVYPEQIWFDVTLQRGLYLEE